MSKDYDNRILRGVDMMPSIGTRWPVGDPPHLPGADGYYNIMVRKGKSVIPTFDFWHSGTKPNPIMVGWGNPDHGPALCHVRVHLPIMEILPVEVQDKPEGRGA